MELAYRFDPKLQLAYGVAGFLAALGVLFMVLGRLELFGASVSGIANFMVAGFYSGYSGKCQ